MSRSAGRSKSRPSEDAPLTAMMTMTTHCTFMSCFFVCCCFGPFASCTVILMCVTLALVAAVAANSTQTDVQNTHHDRQEY